MPDHRGDEVESITWWNALDDTMYLASVLLVV